MKRVPGLLWSHIFLLVLNVPEPHPTLKYTYIPSLLTYRRAYRQTARQTTHETTNRKERQTDRESENANTLQTKRKVDRHQTV